MGSQPGQRSAGSGRPGPNSLSRSERLAESWRWTSTDACECDPCVKAVGTLAHNQVHCGLEEDRAESIGRCEPMAPIRMCCCKAERTASERCRVRSRHNGRIMPAKAVQPQTVAQRTRASTSARPSGRSVEPGRPSSCTMVGAMSTSAALPNVSPCLTPAPDRISGMRMSLSRRLP